VARAVRAGNGAYNVSPDDAIPLRHAIRLAGASRLPVPRTVQRFFPRSGELDYLRYSWTVSNQKIKTELGFSPAKSSSQALLEALGRNPAEAPSGEFDIFGQDKSYIAAFGRTLFDFLYRRYWRVEEKGVDHVPGAGRAVLVGVHRGFMPWDGVMALHSVVQRLGRYPRFLIHPSLVKFPFLFNYMRKLGGIIACQENAEYILDHDEMVGIFPEGIRGAFTLYRDAYQLGKFTSDDYVKLALRKGAAIVPFVTVGSAEIFPILAKWNWNWWKRYTGFPAFPITPTFPFLPPLPLPAKWHTQWLAAIPAGTEYPPEAASDPAIVRSIHMQVRSVMQRAMDDMRAHRRSKFFGSVFEREPAPSGNTPVSLARPPDISS
jgi:1-acyl-sn-glycerol-3-phosphate acyltransferase